MGIITSGIPADITLKLAEINGSRVFIETGTYQGDTTRWAARQFQDVYTIEARGSIVSGIQSGIVSTEGSAPLAGRLSAHAACRPE